MPSHRIIRGIQASAGTGRMISNRGLVNSSNRRLQAMPMPRAIFRLAQMFWNSVAPSGFVPPFSL